MWVGSGVWLWAFVGGMVGRDFGDRLGSIGDVCVSNWHWLTVLSIKIFLLVVVINHVTFKRLGAVCRHHLAHL